MIGAPWDPENGESQIIESENVTYKETISSAGLSNSAVYGQYILVINGIEEVKYFISVSDEIGSMEMIAWDNLTNEEMVKKIAEFYISE